MSKFMMIAGLLLAAIGLALGLMVIFSPAQLMTYGIEPATAAILLTGGVLAIGLGSVIATLEASGAPERRMTQDAYPAARSAAAVPVAAAAAAIHDDFEEEAAGVAKPTTEEAVAALDKAKTDIADALGIPSIASMETKEEPRAASNVITLPDPPASAKPSVEEEEPAPSEEEDQLFVVEEKTIRDRPARVLSDGTVEAETDEGWMRFENLDHLEEYLEAMSPSKA